MEQWLTLENNLEPKRIKAKARQKRLLNLTMSLNLHLVMKTCQKTHQRFNQKQKSESGLQLGMEFAVYMIQIRDSNKTLSIIHLSGRLFQQYLVDQYAKWESNNLRWHRE